MKIVLDKYCQKQQSTYSGIEKDIRLVYTIGTNPKKICL